MKKTAIIIVTLLGIFYACKKEGKTTEPIPVTPPSTCTTCPYCVIDTAVVDTMPHMIATIDDTIHFVASELHDTIIVGATAGDDMVVGKNTFVSGFPEIRFHRHASSSANISQSQEIKDSTFEYSMTYKVNNITFHSKKGQLHYRKLIAKQMPPTYYYYMSNYALNFCFTTDTIGGVSHKITLGSFRVKHP